MPVLSKLWDTVNPFLDMIKEAMRGDGHSSDTSDDPPRSPKKVTILGGGPVGFAMAAYLEDIGFKVIIWAHADHATSFNALRASGELKAVGDFVSGTFKPHTTALLPTALSFSNIVIATVPSHAQDALMLRLAKHDMSKHYLLHIIGNLVAPANRDVWQPGMRPAYQAEVSTAPMNTRMPEGNVFIKGLKHRLVIATWPINPPKEVTEIFESVLPQRPTWLKNVLCVFALGVPAIAHVVTFMHCLGWVEDTEGNFHFYGQAMAAPSISKLMDKCRQQWNTIFAEYGCPTEDLHVTFNLNFDTNFAGTQDFAKNTVPHNLTLGAPKSANHRYFTQDIPYGLVTTVHLAAPVGKPAHLLMTYITQGDAIHDADYMLTGRDITRGITGDIKAGVIALVNFEGDE